MDSNLHIYNTLSRRKEVFVPLHPGMAGLYVCGPTVYGKAHLGHARSAITFDILYRYLTHLGYRTRYVRNITDVGHLSDDADDGEDKIVRQAQMEKLEPMEVVQKFTNYYHWCIHLLNVLPPGIEPRATGHIIEQIALVEKIIDAGYAYESNGSVYFDVEKYAINHHYGELSGRKSEDMRTNTRELEGQQEKRSPLDFAIWKKASPGHLMRWPSRWGEGFPGWHLECTAMSCRYLGETFDIHGGGLDLTFPHHEAEIAQSVAAFGHNTVRYWMHNNMVTLNGQKMGKSLGNAIALDQFFDGSHPLLEKAYSPMAIRYFMLTAHYRSTLDFSNEALQAAEKGLDKLQKAVETLATLKPSIRSTVDVKKLRDLCYEAMNDDLNTPVTLAHLFDGVKMINSIADGRESVDEAGLVALKTLFSTFVTDLLGLKGTDDANTANTAVLEGAVDLLIQLRQEAKDMKNWTAADRIRDELGKLGIVINDKKDGATWEIK